MTRDEILNMPAGIEMDLIVAEKVMEWYVSKSGLVSRRHKPGDLVFGDVCEVTPFSTDISYAWKVHKEMCSRKFSTRITYFNKILFVVKARLNAEIDISYQMLFQYLETEDFSRAALLTVMEL